MRRTIFLIEVLFIAFAISPVFAWFAVPMAYWDREHDWTAYFAVGFGDTTKYGALEIRYAYKDTTIIGDLNLDLPLFGIGTKLFAHYIKSKTFDPRKSEIFVTCGDSSVEITDTRERIEELNVKLFQKYKADIGSFWGIFGEYNRGRYFSDYSIGDVSGFVEQAETTEAQYVGGGLAFGYDTREGDMDPEAGYYFSIEGGARYLLEDTSDADYVNATTKSPKVEGFIYIDQYIYTPTSALPVEIPLLTVQAPTVIAIRTSGAYNTSEVPQLISVKGRDDISLFRGLPPRKLSGYAYFVLAADIRISPIVRMYTPITPLHLLMPRTIPDIRADVEIIPSIDIGKIYGANPEEQFYTWGLALGMKFTKRLTARYEILWTPKFDYTTQYFSIRQPF